MLVLSRRVKEKVKIGNVFMTVLSINQKRQVAKVSFKYPDGDSETYQLTDYLPYVNIEVDQAKICRVEMINVPGNQVRLGFDAPKDVNIDRTEIMGRTK